MARTNMLTNRNASVYKESVDHKSANEFAARHPNMNICRAYLDLKRMITDECNKILMGAKNERSV